MRNTGDIVELRRVATLRAAFAMNRICSVEAASVGFAAAISPLFDNPPLASRASGSNTSSRD